MKKLGIAAFALCLGAGNALAADGFYMRAEVGHSWAASASVKDVGDINNCITCDGSRQQSLGSSPSLGFGVGYKFSPQFRADLTMTYRGWLELDDNDNTNGVLKADVSALALMLNGYYDIPVDLGRFKPYVGAGVGWSHNRSDSLNYNYTAAAVSSGGSAGTLRAPGADTNNFAWQVMAGVGVDIAANAVLDIGYRYFDGGDVIVGRGGASWTGGANYNAGGLKGRLSTHDVTIGLRYSF